MPAGDGSAAYFDTSVLVKCYVAEPGSRQAVAALREHAVVSSAITPIELASARRRRREAGDIAAPAMDALRLRMGRERAQWSLRVPSDAVLHRAEYVAERMPVRALDAVHLASAIVFNEETGLRAPFITADERQRRAATALGLDVIFLQ